MSPIIFIHSLIECQHVNIIIIDQAIYRNNISIFSSVEHTRATLDTFIEPINRSLLPYVLPFV